MVAPRWYQQELIDGTRSAWASGARNVLIVSPPRSGKTKTAVWISEPFIAAHQGVCFQVHRAELVWQLAMEYAEFGHEHDILAPNEVVAGIIQSQVKKFGRSFVRRNALVTIGSVQTINSRAEKLVQWAARIGLWMTDECFVAGTLVDGRPIEEIEVGDIVTAWDEGAGCFVKKPVTRLFRNPLPDEMMRLVIGHHILYVTKGHPFMTKHGWVNAGDLTDDDEILTRAVSQLREDRHENDRGPEVSLEEDRSDILHSSLRSGTSGQEPGEKTTCAADHGLSHVSQPGAPESESDVVLQTERSGFLQQAMLGPVSVEDVVGNNGENEPEICVGKDDRTQPDDQSRNSEESLRDTEGDKSSSSHPRRQREAGDKRGEGSPRDADAVGVHHADRCKNKVAKGPTESLQDRLRTSGRADCNRGGRCESLRTVSAGVGPAQRRVSDWTRVESVEVLQRDDPELAGYDTVYNIEVDDVHTYTVNDMVVHNCHHLLTDNQWGKVVSLFPKAFGAGFTATPARTDRKSLARSQGGVFDAMVKGVTARQLINEGYICEYRIIAPPSSIDRTKIRVGQTGDFTQKGLSDAKRESTITGDCVRSYMEHTPGQQAVVFAVDIEHSNDLCAAYREAGVAAEAVSSKTPSAVRKQVMDKFQRGKFKVLVNVDLFGEGLNVEGIECVIMARPTQSFVLYVQQFFRALTRADDKHMGTIIDHAGNVGFFGKTYGLPDTYNGWTLESEERGKRAKRDPNVIPITTCTACFLAYEALRSSCPHCGHVPEPESRSKPEHVDGDLVELDAETLAALRGEAARIEGEPMIPHGARPEVVGAIRKRWELRRDAQHDLRHAISIWAGVWRDRGADDSEIYRRFYHRFGTDIATAQTLNTKDADNLRSEIEDSFNDFAHTSTDRGNGKYQPVARLDEPPVQRA